MRGLLRTGLAAAAVLFWLASAHADVVLWYNGDADYVNGVSNEINTFVSHSLIYDDFIVPAGGWTIEAVWSNNSLILNDVFTGVTQATWEIRTGVDSGDAGTLIAGAVSPATMTATGRTVFGDPEYTIEVSGLNVVLGPGTYWLAVAPHDNGSGRSFISTTSGLNAVGSPAGNNGNSFWYSTYYLKDFAPDVNGTTYDYSMGVSGTVGGAVPIPEPASVSLAGLGLLLVALRRRRR